MEIEIVGVPLDLGASRRGTDMGPSALRYARLHPALEQLGHRWRDLGNLEVPVPESRPANDGPVRHLQAICAVCADLAEVVAAIQRRDAVPLILGGDHSLAMGTLAGYRALGARPGLLWLDAHADFNTHDTSPSGNVHGMGLAAATGRGLPALVEAAGGGWLADQDVAIVGLRDVDRLERESLRRSGVHAWTMADVDRVGLAAVMERALAVVTDGGRRPLHLSLDLDVLDPDLAPGVGTPVPGGLTYREAHLALELVAATGLCGGVEVVEVNPMLDIHNRTARLAVGLIGSALGQRIL